jgi:hypothetical protein
MSRRSTTVVLAVITLVLFGGLAASASPPKWAIQFTPNAASALNSGLTGVACPSPTSCIAVGAYLSSTVPEAARQSVTS